MIDLIEVFDRAEVGPLISVTDSVVSTSSSSSSPYSAAARTTNPGSPGLTVAVSTEPSAGRAVPFSFTWGLTFVRVFVDYGS